MPGKIKPEKRPLPLKTRQIFNTRTTAKQASAVKPTKPFDPRKERQLPRRVKPVNKKTGPRPSNRNDIIRNRLRPGKDK